MHGPSVWRSFEAPLGLRGQGRLFAGVRRARELCGGTQGLVAVGHRSADRTDDGSIFSPEPTVLWTPLAPVLATLRSIFMPEKNQTSGDARMMCLTGP